MNIKNMLSCKDYDEVNKLVESTSIEDSNEIFLPFLFASNKYKNIKGTFANLSSKTSRGEIARAIYEGIVFSHKNHIDKLLNGRKPQKENTILYEKKNIGIIKIL